jgi:hypothetical protein
MKIWVTGFDDAGFYEMWVKVEPKEKPIEVEHL